jgi:hypothetical protein
MAADEVDVCSNSPLTRRAKSGLSLKNENSSPVTVNLDTTHPNSWPFLYPSAPFTIDAMVPGVPGIQGIVLRAKSDPSNPTETHYYATSGCPNSLLQDTNPKTVIIT